MKVPWQKVLSYEVPPRFELRLAESGSAVITNYTMGPVIFEKNTYIYIHTNIQNYKIISFTFKPSTATNNQLCYLGIEMGKRQ